VIREKLSFILFLPTKMGFYEFLEMRGVLWWLFGVSVLHKKLDLNRESQNLPGLISGSWAIFFRYLELT